MGQARAFVAASLPVLRINYELEEFTLISTTPPAVISSEARNLGSKTKISQWRFVAWLEPCCSEPPVIPSPGLRPPSPSGRGLGAPTIKIGLPSCTLSPWERVGVRVGMGQFVGVEDHCHEAVVPAALAPAELDCQAYADVALSISGLLTKDLSVTCGAVLRLKPFHTPVIPSPGLRPPSPPGRGSG